MHKLKAIEALFEEKITGRMLQTGQALLDASAGRVAIVTDSLTRCGQALERRP
jgi:hypothetical protein